MADDALIRHIQFPVIAIRALGNPAWQREHLQHAVKRAEKAGAVGTIFHKGFVDFGWLNLESAVGQVEGCVPEGAEQGATTRNSDSIPRSCNAVMHRCGRAI